MVELADLPGVGEKTALNLLQQYETVQGVYEHIDEIKGKMEVEVKTRYSAKQAKAKICQDGEYVKVVFDEPQRAPAAGQSAVIYQNDLLIGGGFIESASS